MVHVHVHVFYRISVGIYFSFWCLYLVMHSNMLLHVHVNPVVHSEFSLPLKCIHIYSICVSYDAS